MHDHQLFTALQRQDPAAVQDLVISYGDRLLRSAFLLCGNEAEAEDLVQETFLQALKSAHRFRGGSSIYTWLHAILFNLVRHYHRDRKHIIYEDELASRELPVQQETPSPSDIEITSAALLDALHKLSAPHREVLILRYYEDMKIREMAKHLGVSEGTVKSRLYYALQEMQKHLPNELNLFGNPGTKEMTRV